ncbi:MAG: hypothetical protein LCI00_20845 [Chloroflexi bacterium]|nr:hypothetical protein [Chloroflexota bacterium]MCC6892444.1 hypothetical protein [Anaerolineae bacterium]
MPIGLCGCLIGAFVIVMVLGIGAAVVFLRMPSLALWVAGFTPQGSTMQVFTGQTSAPPVQLENPTTPSQATVNLGSSGVQDLPASNVQTGTIDGSAAAVVSFSEADIMNLCTQRTTFCSNSNAQYKNVRIDLQPNGGVVYADVNVPEVGLQQTIGVVLRLDASRRQFAVAGVDMGGTLYGLPSGELGQRVQEVADKANELLQAASLNASGGVYNLADIRIDTQSITFVLR